MRSKPTYFIARPRTMGFTLVELLTVLLVIGILSGLLLPPLSKAKGRANSTVCLSSLRQWGWASEMFAMDHDDFLPREKAAGSPQGWTAEQANTWAIVSSPENKDVWYNSVAALAGETPMISYAEDAFSRDRFFRKNLFTCPSSKPDRAIDRPMFSVAFNSKLVMNGVVPRKGSAVRPLQTILFAEAGLPGEPKSIPAQAEYDGRPHISANRFSSRHRGNGNLLFFDGHSSPARAGHVVTPEGKAFLPQDQYIWTIDPNADPNLK